MLHMHSATSSRDRQFLEQGKPVFSTHSIPEDDMETWVCCVAEYSEQLVEWHDCEGVQIVLTLGDVGRVEASIATFRPEHDRLFKRAVHRAR